MKKISFLLILTVFFVACSKQDEAPVNLSEVAGTYRGDALKYGPSSCTEGESNELVSLFVSSSKEINICYSAENGLPPFVGFPSMNFTLIEKNNNTWYFSVVPKTTAEFRVWATETQTINGIKCNLVIYPDGNVKAHMGFYDYLRPQGNQFFDFTGKREPKR